jgi:hypothetical protein
MAKSQLPESSPMIRLTAIVKALEWLEFRAQRA